MKTSLPYLVRFSSCLFSISDVITAQVAPEPRPTPFQILAEEATDHKTGLSIAELQSVLEKNEDRFFSDTPNLTKFSLLREWCDAVKKQPNARELLPFLYSEISARRAIDRQPVGWDEFAILGDGGEVGLLWDCVICISGEEGSNKLLETMVAAEDPVKLKILVLQISIRNERPKYDPILKLKLNQLRSPRMKKFIETTWWPPKLKNRPRDITCKNIFPNPK